MSNEKILLDGITQSLTRIEAKLDTAAVQLATAEYASNYSGETLAPAEENS
jgi:hypothetical protein